MPSVIDIPLVFSVDQEALLKRDLDRLASGVYNFAQRGPFLYRVRPTISGIVGGAKPVTYGPLGAMTAGASSNTLGAGTLAPGVPANVNGTLLLMQVMAEVAAGLANDPTGWTLVVSATHAGGELHRVYSRISDGTEGSTVTIPTTAGGGRIIAQIYAVPGTWRVAVAGNYGGVGSTDTNSGADPGGPTVPATASTTLAFIGYDSGGTIAVISGGTGTWTKIAAEATAGSAPGGVGIVAQYADATAGLSGGTAALGNVANANVVALTLVAGTVNNTIVSAALGTVLRVQPVTSDTQITVQLPKADPKNGGLTCQILRLNTQGAVAVQPVGCNLNGSTDPILLGGQIGLTTFLFDGSDFYSDKPCAIAWNANL